MYKIDFLIYTVSMKIPEMRTRTYFLLAAFFILLPKVLGNYQGETGRLLVAAPASDEIFHETVVYVERHSPGSALGFIINVPLRAADLDFEIPAEWKDIPLYNGGPVGTPKETVFYMYGKEQGHLTFSQTEKGKPDGIMLGYAGWGAMQLNYEIVRDRWGVIDYDPALVFGTDPGLVWDLARRRVMSKEFDRGRKVL